MNAPKLITLSLAVSLALAACSKSGEDKPAASAPAQTAAAPAAPIFDVSELDKDIQACGDFNGFVNAKWTKANPIPDDHTSWGPFNILAENSLNTQHEIAEAAAKDTTAASDSVARKIGLLYASGMDEATIEKAGFTPLQPTLDAIGALKTNQDVAKYIVQRYAEGDSQVFEFGAGADFQHAETQIAYANEGGLGLPTKDYYTDPQYAEIRDGYLAYIAKSFELTGASAADAKTQAQQVFDLEKSLASASLSPVEGRDPKNQYHFVSVADANKVTPHFSWEAFFNAQGVSIDHGFSLSQPKFFAQFDKLLASAPTAQWQAYLRFHAIDGAASALSKPFVDNSFEFWGKTLSGQPQQRPRWKRVLGAVNHSMGEGLGQLYVAKVFTPEAKARAQTLVDNVRIALKARIEQLDWMSPETKAKAIAKWDTFLPKIGYPDTWRDWSGLQMKDGDYYGNLQAADKFNYQYDIAKIGKPTDRKEWGMTPQTVNAYYNPTDNTINFPAGILQPPFFDAKADDAINYGGIGAVIGHEASHGFDDEGSQFDGAGNNVNWWSKDDRTKFEARTKQLVDQFNAYAPIKDKPDLHVNGQLTLGENIADLGGINVAYDALQTALKQHPGEADKLIDGYTPDQRFFLNWARVWRGDVREKQAIVYLNADPHAPASLRAIAAPSNMPQFAKAFECKAGDAMVRPDDKRVVIW
ncbi:endothelin-converting enzyme Metallo peptidase. MEROPS family M13 [Pseudoxanthomonas sp. GM95]|uniref:M13 family metallopeptidase n=1 Tax=Pseudoxanthomonas sp. GM95 TaxID=1881043 RepID=UPI0008D31186|nr:M13 family metallopeptidase [Pseudoxanthomonas sp. GM95]SEL78476.1 endothelin-converting enzyme Metallo peptidase. MEROPS family M13 [Pseudoxanthomonas sp. GM95]